MGNFLFKGMPLLLVMYGAVRYPEGLSRFAKAAAHGVPSMMTVIDMGIARNVVIEDYLATDRWTHDLGGLLRTKLSGRDNPECDRWGTPYALADLDSAAKLVSCGPDRECGTSDDLEVALTQREEPQEDARGGGREARSHGDD